MAARWSAAEDERLRDLWERALPIEKIARALGRTVGATYARAARIGLCRARRWTAEENARLRELWPEYSYRAVRAAFQGRSWTAIKDHASALGIRRLRTQGLVSLRTAERVTGVDHRLLKKILEHAGVRVIRLFRRNTAVELDAAIAAVTEWCRAGCPTLPALPPTARVSGRHRPHA